MNIYFYHCSPIYTIANCIETNTNKTNTPPMVILSQGFGRTGGSVGAGRLGSVVQWALKPLPSVNKSVWKRITSLLPFDRMVEGSLEPQNGPETDKVACISVT